MRALLVALAIVVGIQPGLALAQDDREIRRKLYNQCRPVKVRVEELDDNARKIGLTEKRLRETTAVLLRADRLYTDSESESGDRLLYIRILCSEDLCVLKIEFSQYVSDPESGADAIVPTWEYRQRSDTFFGGGVIMQSLVHGVEEFLVEYRRVNEAACPDVAPEGETVRAESLGPVAAGHRKAGFEQTTNPVPITQTTPRYTEAARAAKVGGVVRIQAIVRKDGSLDSFKIIRGLGHGLDEATIQEIARFWRFKPGTRNGEPVDMPITIEVSFHWPTAPSSSRYRQRID